MGSSFCDPTREVCPFGAAIDPTLALVNNVYVAAAGGGAANGPIKSIPGLTPVPQDRRILDPESGFGPRIAMQTLRQAPGVIGLQLPPLTLPGGISVGFPPISLGRPSQQVTQQRQPPLLPGRIPPGPQVVYPTNGGCATGCQPSICCPKGHHPDKKFGVKCVKNRRMNPLNHRALRRAIRRMDGFEGIARKMGYTKKKRR